MKWMRKMIHTVEVIGFLAMIGCSSNDSTNSSHFGANELPNIETEQPTKKTELFRTISPAPQSSPVPQKRNIIDGKEPQPKLSSRQPDPTVPPHRKSKENSVPAQQNYQKKLTLSELRSKYPGSFKVRGSSKENRIALTFDDGPDLKYTPQILDILKSYHVRATFFLVGFRAEEHPEIVRRMLKEGHSIGNHSYNHANPAKLSESQFQSQIQRTEQVLQQISGYSPKLLRTPYGAINETQLKWASSQGYVIVNWDVDSLDWRELNSQQVSDNILSHIHRGAIVLQHCGGGDKQDLSGTVKALPLIIQKLRSAGYELVTLPQLLNVSDQIPR